MRRELLGALSVVGGFQKYGTAIEHTLRRLEPEGVRVRGRVESTEIDVELADGFAVRLLKHVYEFFFALLRVHTRGEKDVVFFVSTIGRRRRGGRRRGFFFFRRRRRSLGGARAHVPIRRQTRRATTEWIA